MKEKIIEWLKEFFRVIALAVIPVLIVELEDGKIDWQLIMVTGIIAALRATEKSLYESGSKVKLPF